MKKEMLINVLQPEECRIAILENGVLEELYVERTGHESYVGNIYKGRIVNIEPSIQAAFVDFGVGRNGFLHISDVEPTYWRQGGEEGRGGHERERDRGERSDRGERGERGDRGERDRDRDRGGRRHRDRDREGGGSVEVEERGEVISEVVEFEPVESVVREPVIEPEHPPADGGDFFAGIDLETAPVAPLDEEPAGGSLVANPDTLSEEDSGKPRRRSRSGPRRKRAPSSEATEESSASTEEQAEPPKPRLMDSAERRTDPGDDAPFDDDLFFPSQKSESKAQPPLTTPDFEPDEELELPEEPEPVIEVFEEPDAEPASEPAPAPPPPPRPRRGRRQPFRLEDALAADLAAADVEPGEDDAPAMPPAALETVEGGEGDDFGPMPEDFDDDLPSPRREGREGREGRGGRGGERRGGRGERSDRAGDRRGGRNGRGAPGGGGGRPGPGVRHPLIQDVFKRGQEVIVQVIKEGIGTKGPTLSTYISIPGRYLVLMPCLNRTGVSRKIIDEEQRRRLRQMFNELTPPKGLGFIMRTAAIDKNKNEVQRDLVYLSRLWQVIVKRIKKLKSPADLYQESEMVTRTIRDNFSADIESIWVDEKNAFESAQEFMQVVMPRYADRIKFYEGREPLFHKYGVEDELHRIQQKKVPLPNGGSIVIEQTEALVAIDVNSGNFRADNNAEETAYQMNLHAAREIARQLRLRDLGGVVVNDFIDMRDEKHRRNVEHALRDAMKRDRARTKILKISQFGLIEMTRQRIRPSLKRSGYMECPHCKGHGAVKTPETMALEILRMIQMASTREPVCRVEVGLPAEVCEYLLNRKRREIVSWEESGQMTVNIRGMHGVAPEHLEFVCMDRNDNEVRLNQPEPMPFRPRR